MNIHGVGQLITPRYLINYVAQPNSTLASYRYRIEAIVAALADDNEIIPHISQKMDDAADLYVLSKHSNPNEIEKAFQSSKPTIVDICDNHFDAPHWGKDYHRICSEADVVTCNSSEMFDEIMSQVPGVRSLYVIPEPYEMPELNPSYHINDPPRWMWFGGKSNLNTLDGIQAPGVVNIVSDVSIGETGKLRFYPYSYNMLIGVSCLSDCVVIPTNPKDPSKRTKSPNRLIEALRLGKFVVASEHPAHEPFGQFCWLGDINEGSDWFAKNADVAREMVVAGQEYIKDRYSLETISSSWRRLFYDVVTV